MTRLHPFGFAGRGQRTVRGELSKDDQRWIADSIRLGGLFMEPAVDIVAEFSLHGLLRQSRLLVGKTCRFHTDAWGAPETMVVAEPERVRDSALVETLERVAEGLARAGYFGPLGIDAYYWRHHESTRFNSLGELNATFTLAWSLGMGSAPDAALELYAG
jgi:hypothetical protein